ncbi:alkaline phosphatase PhoX [Halopelagius fulvigenes]|uniref:Alkaline phosphatase PhoX n=1 Tax=Halopelagius fulvigenes TaxID=1198324 RepID=A0ABD5U1X2_9EURY
MSQLDFTRREAILALVTSGVTYSSTARGGNGRGAGKGERGHEDGHHEEGGPTLNRFATSIVDSEVTGIFVTESGRFFFNVQHPDRDLKDGSEAALVGALSGFNFHDLPEDFPSVQIPASDDFDYDDELGDGVPESYDSIIQTAYGGYQPLMEGGADLGDGEELGVPLTPDGELADAEEYITSKADYNGYVPVEGGDSKDGRHEGYLFTNWETRPGMVSRMHISSRGDGPWRVHDAENLEFRDVGGTYNNCFGTVSPWGTPLTSEENYEVPSTDQWNNPDSDVSDEAVNVARHLGHEPNDDGVYDEEYPNPFRYGYIVEIRDPTAETPTPVKHFTLGRATHENAVVMPDGKTAYTTSDGTGEGFFKFVADEAEDLSSGTLYAAKASQKGPVGGDPADVSFGIEWIELGHATNEEIESWIAEYDGITQADYTEGETSYISDAEVREWAAGNADDDRVAFLESTRAAGAVGATDEFRKMEGINVRRGAEPGDFAYVAMSETTKTFLPNEKAGEGNTDPDDDLQINGDDWGVVYRLQLREEGETVEGRSADHDYDVLDLVPVVAGGPNANICGGCPYDARPDSASTVCRDCSFNPTNESEEGFVGVGLEKLKSVFDKHGFDPTTTIANPDNIVVMDDGRVIIGEDSSNAGHENNMIWIYNPGEDERPGKRREQS